MRSRVVAGRMRLVVLGLLALALATPVASAYRDCFVSRLACAEYDWKTDDAYVDVETESVQAGAGDRGSGDFQGRDAYLFSGSTYVAAYEGEYREQEQTLVMASVAGRRLVSFEMADRIDGYPSQYHCIELGPGALYHRCATGLP